MLHTGSVTSRVRQAILLCKPGLSKILTDLDLRAGYVIITLTFRRCDSINAVVGVSGVAVAGMESDFPDKMSETEDPVFATYAVGSACTAVVVEVAHDRVLPRLITSTSS